MTFFILSLILNGILITPPAGHRALSLPSQMHVSLVAKASNVLSIFSVYLMDKTQTMALPNMLLFLHNGYITTWHMNVIPVFKL